MHPFDAIQEGIDAAGNGDTVVVLSGTYIGIGNRDIDFGGKAIVLHGISGSASTNINCQRLGRAFVFDSGETSASAVIGFKIRNCHADGNGGAILCDNAHPQFRDCVISSSSVTEGYLGGGIYGTLSFITLDDCSIVDNEPNGIWMSGGGARVLGNIVLSGNDWTGIGLTLEGDGTISLYNGALLNMDNSSISCNITGEYDITVDLGSELVIERWF